MWCHSLALNAGREGGHDARPRAPGPFQGDLRNLPEALDPLKKMPNWVCWRLEWRVDKKGVGKWTKPPLSAEEPTADAKNNDPSTWGTYEQALAAFEAGKCDGIGFNLSGTDIAAFDIDKCRDRATGEIAPEAMKIVNRATSYTEMTPSGTGLRVIGYGSGAKVHRKQKIPGSSVEVESYRSAERYITITGNPLPADLAAHGRHRRRDRRRCGRTRRLQGRAGKTRPSRISTTNSRSMPQTGNARRGITGADRRRLPAGRSDRTHREGRSATGRLERRVSSRRLLACRLWLVGGAHRTRIAGKPIVPERYAKRLGKEIARCLHKRRPGARARRHAGSGASRSGSGVALDDFYAYMPRHSYIFVPTREMWPASSVNSRLPKVPLQKKNGAPVLDENGNPKHSKPSVWLDKHRPVEQMTWAPGEPLTIDGRLIAEGGWFERPGVTTFNLYRPPTVRQGNSANADRWVELVQRVYPDDADHIITYCAHRIQHPAVKINHGIILGGAPGIGKDTLLEPLKHGVGPWNFREVSPQDIMSNYNDYMRCVVLRISEAHDLGDINRYAFYDHMKTILATPPDVIRVNGKYIPQHYVLNVAGVIYTTNHRFDGVYLPADDRRTYVAWSEVRQG